MFAGALSPGVSGAGLLGSTPHAQGIRTLLWTAPSAFHHLQLLSLVAAAAFGEVVSHRFAIRLATMIIARIAQFHP